MTDAERAEIAAADTAIMHDPDRYKTTRQIKSKQPKPKPPDKPKPVDRTHLVTDYCRRCIYLINKPKCCIFAAETGTTRPCPAGDGCIVRKTKREGQVYAGFNRSARTGSDQGDR